MSDQFDKDLTKKIRETFEDLEVPFEEKHWSALKNRMDQKKSGLLYVWQNPALKVAAGILLIFGIFLAWDFVGPNNGENTNLAEKQTQPEESIAQNEESEDSQSNTVADNARLMPGSKKSANGQNEEKISTSLNKETESHSFNKDGNEKLISAPARVNEKNPAIDPAIVPDAELTGVYGLITNSGDDLKIIKKTKSRNLKQKEDEIFITEKKVREKSGLEISAATLVNYSDAEQEAPIGFSGGVGSELQISRRISLHSGIYITSQQLKVGDSNVEVNFQSVSGTTDLDTFANLWAIDIPINMRFYLNERRSGSSYFSVGFSSLAYLSEKYTDKIETLNVETVEAEDGSVTINRAIVQTVNITRETPLSTFDLARILNISMGFQYDIGRDLFLTIEPYIKYPLGPLTSEDVIFGSGGINMQLRF